MRKLTIFILSFACFVASAEAVPTYRIRDLGDLSGGRDRSFAIDINNAGWIVGEVGAAGGPRAALWKRKSNGTYKLMNLGVFQNHDSSIANSINADNVIVGRSRTIGEYFSGDGVRWTPKRNGKYVGRSLGDLADAGCTHDYYFGGTEAFAINSDGWTVGISDDCSFVWRPGVGMAPLFQFPGSTHFERLVDINNNNIAVGTNYGPPVGCCAPRPVVWNAAQLTQVLLPVNTAWGYAEGINSKGWIVGQDGDFNFGCCDTQAVLWKPQADGTYTSTVLGPLAHSPTAFTSEALALDINRHGEVVGSVSTTDDITTGERGKAYAFYWDEATGFRSLSDLIARNDPLRGKFRLLRAYAINDRGSIVGFGLTAKNKFHGFLLTRQ